MTGIVGGHATGSTLEDVRAELWEESWYGTDRVESGEFGIAMNHHGKRDRSGRSVWTDGSRGGVCYGVVSNRHALGLEAGALFERVLDDPTNVLPRCNGSFLIACFDANTDTFVVATDKLGTRTCYYTETGPFLAGTSVRALLTHVDEPTIDLQGVSDLLMMAHVWGEKTLVEEVKAVPSGSILRHESGETTIESYWEHTFDFEPKNDYVPELVDRYRTVIDEMAGTLDGDTGLFLSGGLDSRAMAAALAQSNGSLTTYTYDSNPAGGGNPEIARTVADRLGVPNVRIELTPDTFMDAFDTGIRVTDGMVGWKSLVNISAVCEITDEVDVMLEAAGQGGFLGWDVWKPYVEKSDTAVEALYRSAHSLDREVVEDLFEPEIDPLDTYRDEAAKSLADTKVATVLDTHYSNYYPRGDFANDELMRAKAGTRVPLAHSSFLEHVTSMPYDYRVPTIPLTGDKIPYGTAKLKLELIRGLNSGMESIPYEQTNVAPARPLWQHALGFVVGTSVDRLRGKTTYGGWSMPGEWYRDHTGLRTFVDDLVDAACDRPFFDDGTIRRLQQEHHEGTKDHITAISGVTTIERWLQQTVD